MTREEIAEAQEQLRSSLSPQLLAFLQSRRRPGTADKPPVSVTSESNGPPPLKTPEDGLVPMEVSTSEDQAMSVEKLNGSGPEQKSDTEPVPPEAAEVPICELLKRYPHMNHDEPEKREWMADVPAAAAVSGQAAAGYTARFGFDGRLLDPSIKVIKLCVKTNECSLFNKLCFLHREESRTTENCTVLQLVHRYRYRTVFICRFSYNVFKIPTILQSFGIQWWT